LSSVVFPCDNLLGMTNPAAWMLWLTFQLLNFLFPLPRLPRSRLPSPYSPFFRLARHVSSVVTFKTEHIHQCYFLDLRTNTRLPPLQSHSIATTDRRIHQHVSYPRCAFASMGSFPSSCRVSRPTRPRITYRRSSMRSYTGARGLRNGWQPTMGAQITR